MAESRIDDLRRRLERDPDSRLFAQLAEELRKRGDVAEAIEVARGGLKRHPEYPSARLTLGRALLDSRDPGGARAELDAAVAGAPDNILASRLLGEALESLGDLGSALAQYQATLLMAPGDAHVEARIRAIQSRLGAPDAEGGTSATPDVTEPMKVPNVPEEGGSGGDGGKLPPTIRMSAAEIAARAGRASLPPRAGAASVGETTLPAKAGERERGVTSGAVRPAAPPSIASTAPPRSDGSTSGAAAAAADLPPKVVASVSGQVAPPGAESKEWEEDGAPAGRAPVPAAHERRVEGSGQAQGMEAVGTKGTPAPVANGHGGAAAAPAGEAALSSATLAELYFEQGLLERAVEVYAQVLAEDPANGAASARLAEIERMVAAGAADLPLPVDAPGDDAPARRRALERTIERLEGLLAIVQRR